MKVRSIYTILLWFMSAIFFQGSVSGQTGIIPVPANMTMHEGRFILDNNARIILDASDGQSGQLADELSSRLHDIVGGTIPVATKDAGGKGSIMLQIARNNLPGIGSEGYILEVNPDRISIKANKPAGLFYGVQTLYQLLPPAIEGKIGVPFKEVAITCLSITDYPRFPWRGLMLDVSRHFFTVDEVKDYIDQMVKYKFNVFHWHLTDDQGWRIEIKSLPKLTEVGAWRVPRTGLWWTFDPPKPGEKASYGGFYTQDQIKEVVAYAAERHVTILPEIDVPGHSLAMIAAYPELSSTGKPYFVNPGSKFYTIEDNALCPGKEKVFEILDKVFGEVAGLFPCEYIHIGGDECYKGFWKESPECKELMAREGIKNLDELQSWFVKRLEKILKEKGKKLVGWDEILEGGLAPEATVMSWRGMDGGIKAAQMGHKVIMTPTTHCYLDLYQGDPSVEPATYSMLRLSDVYRFEPVPAGVDPSLILGGQGNLWTESVAVQRHAEYMTWPRAFALSEVLWSPKELKNWDSFIDRMEEQFVRLDFAQVKYARSAYDPIIKVTEENGQKKVHLSTEINGLDIHYSFDESSPDPCYPVYNEPLAIPDGAANIKAVAVRNGKIVAREIRLPFAAKK